MKIGEILKFAKTGGFPLVFSLEVDEDNEGSFKAMLYGATKPYAIVVSAEGESVFAASMELSKAFIQLGKEAKCIPTFTDPLISG